MSVSAISNIFAMYPEDPENLIVCVYEDKLGLCLAYVNGVSRSL